MKKLLYTLALLVSFMSFSQVHGLTNEDGTPIYLIDLDIPFALVDEVPVFPGCETIDKWVYNYHLLIEGEKITDDKIKAAKRRCFQEKIMEHISKNFRYPEIAQEMGIQGRVFVQFMFDRDGSITGIRTRGPDKNLEDEARRIFSLLPKMIKPAMHTNSLEYLEAVRVPFSIPISFRLQ